MLGTTARQKLLALKLAKAAKCDNDQLAIEKLDLKVEVNDNLNKPAVGLSAKKGNTTKNAAEAKRLEKQRLLEAVYAAGSKNEEKTKAQMRMTLKANLAKNAKKTAEAAAGAKHRRIVSVTLKDNAAWREASTDMVPANSGSTAAGSIA